MKEIKLQKACWTYDDSKQLGPAGGFGTVFLGYSVSGDEVAIKRLNLDDKSLAHREMNIAKELLARELEYVLPFIDAGQDAISHRYFTVMPKADKDLQSEIETKCQFSEAEAVAILREIVVGLLEVSDLVHRDLKPRNVLYHDGKWRIADFGIARFVEESTSLNTLKSCLSPPYAAPEQWQDIRASHATDVYALGCIAYALLTGHPPFRGPEQTDFRKQHLNELPQRIEKVSPQLRSLLSMMLRKRAESRPELKRVDKLLNILQNSKNQNNNVKGFEKLAIAGEADAERVAQLEADEQRAVNTHENRKEIAREGVNILNEIFMKLEAKVRNQAPTAKIEITRKSSCKISMGKGKIEWIFLDPVEPYNEEKFEASQFDILTGATIRVIQDSQNIVGYGSSLWYRRSEKIVPYRWHEVSYFRSLSHRQFPYAPFELESPEYAYLAESNITWSSYQVAFGPKPIDGEDSQDFLDRWLKRFAEASLGQLQPPRYLPIG